MANTVSSSSPPPLIPSDERTCDGADSPFRIGFITDIEGNLDYFFSYVERSQVLDWMVDDDAVLPPSKDSKSFPRLLLRPNCYFVMGGDLVDKGPGDIRLCRAMLDLKLHYPDRVVLLVGNRDINKLRLTAELSDRDMERIDIPPPHWDPRAPSFQQYLETLQQTKFPESSLQQLNTRVHRLQYIFHHTLGCPQTFEFRRQELSLLLDRPAIPDDEVVDSFLEEVQAGGSLYEFLQHAHVAARIGNTLFCHGAVDRNTMKFVPSSSTKFEIPSFKDPGHTYERVDDWIGGLNEFWRQGLEDYRCRPGWDDSRTTRGGEALLALQNRPAVWGRSVISNCYGDGGCITTEFAAAIRTDPQHRAQELVNPLVFEKVSSDPMDGEVADWLLQDGIRRVVVGHKPTGDCPAVLSAEYTGVEVVSADTSFSDTRAEDNRGAAVGVVEIVGESEMNNHLEISGRLQDGTEYSCQLNRFSGESGVDTTFGDSNIGKQWKDGWWLKAFDPAQKQYHLTRGKGRKVEYLRVDEATVTQRQPA